MGRISPLDGIGPEQLHLQPLLEQLSRNEIDELVFALSPTLEGDGTASWLGEKAASLSSGIQISELARGVPSGGALSKLTKATLVDAIVSRQHQSRS